MPFNVNITTNQPVPQTPSNTDKKGTEEVKLFSYSKEQRQTARTGSAKGVK